MEPHHTSVSRQSLRDFMPLIVIALAIVLLTFGTAKALDATTGRELMRLFMGFFFVVFGGFKIVNWKGFVNAYKMYDVLAKRSVVYAYTYPLIELALGLAYLFSFQLMVMNWITLALMLVGAYGVWLKLREHEEIPCACLGVVFTIPMTWVTLIEDLLMAAMAAYMLFGHM